MDSVVWLGQFVVIVWVQLVQDQGVLGWLGFLIFILVYDCEGGVCCFKGFVYSLFCVLEFLELVVEFYSNCGVEIVIYDGVCDVEYLFVKCMVFGDNGLMMMWLIVVVQWYWIVEVSLEKLQFFLELFCVMLIFGIIILILVFILVCIFIKCVVEDCVVFEWLMWQINICILLICEFNYWVKNMLVNVLLIVLLICCWVKDIDDFVESLIGCVCVFLVMYDIFLQIDWSVVLIVYVICSELVFYMEDDEVYVEMGGFDISFVVNEVLLLGFVIYELVINVVKYGVLSVDGVKVVVIWCLFSFYIVEVYWCECGGLLVCEFEQCGFGCDLIEKIVVQELGVEVELCFLFEGVECCFKVLVWCLLDFVLCKGVEGG